MITNSALTRGRLGPHKGVEPVLAAGFAFVLYL